MHSPGVHPSSGGVRARRGAGPHHGNRQSGSAEMRALPRPRHWPGLVAIVAILLPRAAEAQSFVAYHVRDIPTIAEQLEVVDDGLFLFGTNPADSSDRRSPQLWRTDGTAAGTALLANLPAVGFEGEGLVRNLTAANGMLFFELYPAGFDDVDDGPAEIWRSDGSAAGTLRVIGDLPRKLSASRPFELDLTSVNATLFYRTTGGLWRSDGTAAGTVLVKPVGEDVSSLGGLTNVDGTLFFIALRPESARPELWRSDGTAAGTVRLRELPYLLNTGPDGIFETEELGIFVQSAQLTAVGKTVFFLAFGADLWRSDGTPEGTVRLNAFLEAGDLTDIAGMLFFWADDGLRGFQLWRSDGTAAGTRPASAFADFFPISRLTELNGMAAFHVARYAGALQCVDLWRSDGTIAGTTLLKEFCDPAHPVSLPVSFEGAGFFMVEEITGSILVEGSPTASTSLRLWTSDGTPAGTVPLDGLPEYTDAVGVRLAVLDGKLLGVNEAVDRARLWAVRRCQPGEVCTPGCAPTGPCPVCEVAPDGCDDQNVCTVDTCHPGEACTHDPVDFTGVRTPLVEWVVTIEACAQDSFPDDAGGRLHRAQELLGRAEGARTKRARLLLRKAAKQLKMSVKASRSARGRSLSPKCADALTTLADDAGAQVKCLLRRLA